MKSLIFTSLISLLFITQNLFATSIVPFSNLGKMADASTEVVFAKVTSESEVIRDEIVYTQIELEVIQSIKGNLVEGGNFKIQKWSRKGANWINTVAGDIDLIQQHNYLLFLEPYLNIWRPLMLSHNIHEEILEGGESLLVPVEESSNMSIYPPNGGIDFETEAVYRKNQLFDLFEAYLNKEIQWNREEAVFSTDVEEFNHRLQDRNAPTHCAYLMVGGNGVRWSDFPSTALPVRYPAADDTDCNPGVNANTFVQTAINSLNNNYPDINMSDGGTHAYVPDCSSTPPSARLGNYINYVGSNFGSRNEMIIFNDPCNEISNLINCSGTLAIGGAYAFSPTTQFNGQSWYQAAYGYVIINNDVCTCLSQTDYELVLTHEMTHSLGLAHISPAYGAANMNGTCCQTITNLDKACVSFEYSPILPVELESFYGLKKKQSVDLKWTTVNEFNSASFDIERSRDGRYFSKIGAIQAAGNSQEKLDYQFSDVDPLPGSNYYRLSQEDDNGKTEHLGNILHYEFKFATNEIKVVPNPVNSGIVQFDLTSTRAQSSEVSIYDFKGSMINKQSINLNIGTNNVNIHANFDGSGVYFLQLRLNNKLYHTKFSVLD